MLNRGYDYSNCSWSNGRIKSILPYIMGTLMLSMTIVSAAPYNAQSTDQSLDLVYPLSDLLRRRSVLHIYYTSTIWRWVYMDRVFPCGREMPVLNLIDCGPGFSCTSFLRNHGGISSRGHQSAPLATFSCDPGHDLWRRAIRPGIDTADVWFKWWSGLVDRRSLWYWVFIYWDGLTKLGTAWLASENSLILHLHLALTQINRL